MISNPWFAISIVFEEKPGQLPLLTEFELLQATPVQEITGGSNIAAV